VKLVISDAHEGLKAAISKVLHATWQRCRVHAMRNLLAHAGRQGRGVVAAFIGTAFAQEDAASARAQWRQVADQLRPKAAKLATMMDDMEADVLAYMGFAPTHRAKLHSTKPIERLNGEIKRRTDGSASFQMRPRSVASWAPSCWSRMTCMDRPCLARCFDRR
jgi:putative transposase